MQSAQHRVHPTGGSRRVFGQGSWFESGPVKTALSRPAHPRVTPAVRRLGATVVKIKSESYANRACVHSHQVLDVYILKRVEPCQ